MWQTILLKCHRVLCTLAQVLAYAGTNRTPLSFDLARVQPEICRPLDRAYYLPDTQADCDVKKKQAAHVGPVWKIHGSNPYQCQL